MPFGTPKFPQNTTWRYRRRMSEFAVETKGLDRSFKTRPIKGSKEKKVVHALDGVDIQIKKGELFGLLGPNGAGKTTLIKILCTLLLPSGGEARVMDFDVEKQSHQIRRIINM